MPVSSARKLMLGSPAIDGSSSTQYNGIFMLLGILAKLIGTAFLLYLARDVNAVVNQHNGLCLCSAADFCSAASSNLTEPSRRRRCVNVSFGHSTLPVERKPPARGCFKNRRMSSSLGKTRTPG